MKKSNTKESAIQVLLENEPTPVALLKLVPPAGPCHAQRMRRPKPQWANARHNTKKEKTMKTAQKQETVNPETLRTHTPGPWHEFFFGRGNREGCIFASEGRTRLQGGGTTLYPICKIIDFDREAEANARLIASAPELLKALKDAKAMLKTACRYFPKSVKNSDRFSLLNVLANSIEPAIARAEGDF